MVLTILLLTSLAFSIGFIFSTMGYRVQMKMKDQHISTLQNFVASYGREILRLRMVMGEKCIPASSDLYGKLLKHVSKDGLNKVWRVVALELHPDRHPTIDAEWFKEASPAYDSLTNK